MKYLSMPEAVPGTNYLGKPIIHLASVDSTNNYLAHLALEGQREGTIVVADHQPSGRGRRGRQWDSPPGLGLSFSVLLRIGAMPEAASPPLGLVTLMAGVAAAEAIGEAIRGNAGAEAPGEAVQNDAGLGAPGDAVDRNAGTKAVGSVTAVDDPPGSFAGARVGIKWPNDVLLGRRKVAGILAESGAGPEAGGRWIVLGIGINVNQRPEDFSPEIQHKAASIAMGRGEPVPPAGVLISLIQTLDQLYGQWKHGRTEPVLRRWREMCLHLGQPVTVTGAGETMYGRAKDITDQGLLILETMEGIREVAAGEVSLRWEGFPGM